MIVRHYVSVRCNVVAYYLPTLGSRETDFAVPQNDRKMTFARDQRRLSSGLIGCGRGDRLFLMKGGGILTLADAEGQTNVHFEGDVQVGGTIRGRAPGDSEELAMPARPAISMTLWPRNRAF